MGIRTGASRQGPRTQPPPLEALVEQTWTWWAVVPHPHRIEVTHRFPARTFLSWHPGAALWSEEGLRGRLLAVTSARSPLPHAVPSLDGRIRSAKSPVASWSVWSAETPPLLPVLHVCLMQVLWLQRKGVLRSLCTPSPGQ